MCGIAGILDRSGPVAREDLLQMAATMIHRGPDAEGLFLGEARGHWGGLVHRRLSIIDLEGGSQPLSSEDGQVHAVVNGEIYNYQELRERLEARGHRFSSRSDSEVIVHLYEEEGEDLLGSLEGMYAFAVWDRRRGRLLLGRDPFGKKPLVYRTSAQGISFASSIAAIRTLGEVGKIDPIALDLYLTLQYVPAPWTILEGVRKLPPGHLAVWEEGDLKIRCHYRPEASREGIPCSYDEAVEETRRQVLCAVERRLMADVPLGAFLSGGIDSSVLVAAMTQLRGDVETFSIGFEDAAYDERSYAAAVAEFHGTKHHVEIVRPDARKILESLVRHYGEPFADSSAVPTWYLSEVARRQVTVALSGDGGDELFLGYDRYRAVRFAGWIDAWLPGAFGRLVRAGLGWLPETGPPRHPIRRIRRFVDGLARSPRRRYLEWVSIFDFPRRRGLYRPEWREQLESQAEEDPALGHFEAMMEGMSGVDPMSDAARLDLVTYLPGDLLTKVDVASMAHSLEVRCPFLDPKLAGFALGLPRSWKFAGGISKKILRDAFARDLPPQILKRPKAGFAAPIGRWLREDLSDLVEEKVVQGALHPDSPFCPHEVSRMAREHVSGRADHAGRLWALLMWQFWKDQ